MPKKIIRRKHRLSSFQTITLGFAGVILLGALLLMLPISTTAGCVTPFNETLFTATSAVCVTGLVVQDDHSGTDPDRRTWRHNRSSIVCAVVRAKNLPDAAQHHARCNFCAKGRRNRPSDTVHLARNVFDRTAGRTGHAAGVLP